MNFYQFFPFYINLICILCYTVLNSQRAAMSAKDFQHKMSRTRKMLFQEIVKTYPYGKGKK